MRQTPVDATAHDRLDSPPARASAPAEPSADLLERALDGWERFLDGFEGAAGE
ncbi:hypothetical protein [Streptomyces sp. NPDC029721]|uniref:hypothetical protein n=1 Tax=Streptomyces sp. NPDC029721 TaxID=3157090 RepID=UPI0033EC9D4C